MRTGLTQLREVERVETDKKAALEVVRPCGLATIIPGCDGSGIFELLT